ncbi:MAG: pyridoxal-phosphate dependent enzyme [Candidatus Wallbacteria bacterium]|nr:pyridoxal-phosphate dependent enzyme [Candidatus Wallbacteria bacterium]
MLHPRKQPAVLRKAADAARRDELNPANLFNIHWRDPKGSKVRKLVLPPSLTGVKANVVVLVGRDFPSGSHKVGPAYSTLVEGEVKGEIRPGEKTVLGPSTGNFGIGTAYVSKLKGYKCVVIMPDGMSKERYERIRKYGGALDLTPGTESDVILTLERTYALKKNPKNYPLAQFELLPNYRFHRYVTGRSALEAAQDVGDGRIACFVSAPGSAGTLAAGDEIKSVFPDAAVAAVEPRECATLYSNLRGQHRIEGIGDKMVTLIHNLLTTDYVVLVHDDDCVMGVKLFHEAGHILTKVMGLDGKLVRALAGVFGVSGVCNVLGAIKMARQLDLGANQNVVTIATDGIDRYYSVVKELEERTGRIDDHSIDDRVLARWAREIFLGADTDEILDVRGAKQKKRLFDQKEEVWTQFGYGKTYLDTMKKQSFWDAEYALIPEMDREIAKLRD